MGVIVGDGYVCCCVPVVLCVMLMECCQNSVSVTVNPFVNCLDLLLIPVLSV